jgi:uncharacterized protein (TIRG00374 family)
MKTRVLFWLKIGVSVALLAYLLTLIDLDQLFERLRNLKFRYLALAYVLLLAQVGFSSLKWQLILRSDGVVMRLAFLVKTYLIGSFVSLFLPTSFGGDVYRVVAARGVNRDMVKSASSVLFDRLSGFFALISICLLGYVALPAQPYEQLVLIIYGLGVTGFLVLSSDTAISFVNRFSTTIVRKAAQVLVSFRNYRTNLRTLALVLLIAFLFQANVVVINKVYTLALGIDVAFSLLIVIIPLIYLTEVLPISINGLGVRESAFAFFFMMNGLSVEDGIAVSLLIVAERYLLGLLGGSLLLATVMSSKDEARANADAGIAAAGAGAAAPGIGVPAQKP